MNAAEEEGKGNFRQESLVSPSFFSLNIFLSLEAPLFKMRTLAPNGWVEEQDSFLGFLGP